MPATKCDRIIVLIHAFLNFSPFRTSTRGKWKGRTRNFDNLQHSDVYALPTNRSSIVREKKSFVCWTNWSSFFDKHTFTLLNQQYKDGSTVHLLVLLVITLLLEIGRVVKHSKKVIRRTVRSSLLAGSGIVIMCVCLCALSVTCGSKHIKSHCVVCCYVFVFAQRLSEVLNDVIGSISLRGRTFITQRKFVIFTSFSLSINVIVLSFCNAFLTLI